MADSKKPHAQVSIGYQGVPLAFCLLTFGGATKTRSAKFEFEFKSHLQPCGDDVIGRVGCNGGEPGGLERCQRRVLEKRDARSGEAQRVEIECRHRVVVRDQNVAVDCLELVQGALVWECGAGDLQIAHHLPKASYMDWS